MVRMVEGLTNVDALLVGSLRATAQAEVSNAKLSVMVELT